MELLGFATQPTLLIYQANDKGGLLRVIAVGEHDKLRVYRAASECIE